MRILHVVHKYPPAVGGAELVMAELSRRLVRRGHQVEVYTTNALDNDYMFSPAFRKLETGVEAIDGVRIRRFSVRHPRRSGFLFRQLRRVPDVGPSLTAAGSPWVPAFFLKMITARRRFDIVHATCVPYDSLLCFAWLYARRTRVPFVCTPHLHLADLDDPNAPILFSLPHQIALLRRTDAVIVNSMHEGSFMNQQGVPPARVYVIPNGVDPGVFLGGDARRLRERLNLKHRIVSQISTQSIEKGSVQLIEAMKLLWRSGLDADLVLAGTVRPDAASYLERQPKEIRNRITLLNVVDSGMLRDLYAAADVFAMVSRAESFGLVYLEAWVNAKPVIAALLPVQQELIKDGEDGLLVPFGDVSALAGALRKLIGDEAMCRRLGEAGRRKALDHYSWEPVVSRTETLYRSLAQGLPERLRSQTEGRIATSPALTETPYVSVIVLNCNGRRLLEPCLNALRAQTFRDFETILVDNGSIDSSVSYVRRRFPEVIVLELSRNMGFSRAVNRGILRARGRLVVLLHNDAVADSNWLAALVGAARDHASAGMFASLILNDKGLVQAAGHGLSPGALVFSVGKRNPQEKYGGVHAAVSCSGIVAAYRREMLDEVGPFDENLHAYYENVDLALRAQLKGWRCLCVPQARVTHYGRSGFPYSSHHLMLLLRNRFLVVLKDFPLPALWFQRREIWRQTAHCFVLVTERLRSEPGRFLMAGFFVRLGIGTLRRLPATIFRRSEIQRSARIGPGRFMALLQECDSVSLIPDFFES
jgi:glycogen(starch) synthase